MLAKKHFGTVNDFGFSPSDIGGYYKALKSLKGKEVEVVIRPKIKTRTTPENRYYFGVICKIVGDYMGCDPEEAHTALKMELLPVERKGIKTCKSTKDLSIPEFEDYCKRCRHFGATFMGLFIPLPNEVDLY